MGQYYNIALKKKGTKTFKFSDRSVDGEYMMAKLTEHSWLNNGTMEAICALIENQGPTQLAWIGDYAEEEDLVELKKDLAYLPVIEKAWKDGTKYISLTKAPSGYHSNTKILINHDLKEYVVMSDYAVKVYNLQREVFFKKIEGKSREEQDREFQWYEWEVCFIAHPLSLLTAVGNDKGGGDYHSGYKDFKFVGRWAFDTIEIVDNDSGVIAELWNKKYKPLEVAFTERITEKEEM